MRLMDRKLINVGLIATYLCTMISSGAKASSWTDKVQLSAEGRLRSEAQNDTDFSSANDDLRFTIARFRLGFDFRPVEESSIFVQPQYSATFGQPQVVNASTASVTDSGNNVQSVPTAQTQNTSGSLFDNSLSLHQAYISHRFADSFEMKLGRQEIVYGDELLIGSVGWSNVGRSFDALKSSVSYEAMQLDLFWAKITDRNISSSGDGDSDFLGAYSVFKDVYGLTSLDFYLLFSRDPSGTPNLIHLYTYGSRLKSAWNSMDYRAEITGQYGSMLGASQSAFQADGELGYSYDWLHKSRASLHLLYASEDYNQLYPTAHKWLGHLDLLGRRNIMASAIHFQNWLNEKWGVLVDAHEFFRVQTDKPAYKLNGSTGLGTGVASKSRNIGTELDASLIYKINEALTTSGGGSFFLPGTYIERELGDKKPLKAYIEVVARF